MIALHQWLTVIGLVFDFIGALILVTGLIISKKEALMLGVYRVCEDTDEENLTLPQVADRLKQSKRAIIGLVFLFIGFFLQAIGSLVMS